MIIAGNVLTGAPGTGKTAILSQIHGVVQVEEPAREVLAVHRSTVGVGDIDPHRFVGLMLERAVERYLQAASATVPVVFDRGIPDNIAYARWLGVDDTEAVAATAEYRYDGVILVTRPWREIYRTDADRRLTFDQTTAWHPLFEEAYQEAGYDVVEVPRAPLADRASFVASIVGPRPIASG